MEVAAGEMDEFGHARLGGIGQRARARDRAAAPASRRAPRCSATSSAAARPTAFDRVLATRLGLAAIDAAHDGRWGTMPALRGTRIELVPLSDAVGSCAPSRAEDYEAASTFFG